jgi:hypothetical protein
MNEVKLEFEGRENYDLGSLNVTNKTNFKLHSSTPMTTITSEVGIG